MGVNAKIVDKVEDRSTNFDPLNDFLGETMRNLILSTSTAALFATQSLAGGMAEPIQMAPAVIVEETKQASSSSGVIVPLILIAVLAAALSSSGGGDGTGFMASDARLKTDIVRVGTAANGLPLYHFRYIGDSVIWEGVMAQDVLTHTPAAVGLGIGGTMAVNYDMLGLQMRRVS